MKGKQLPFQELHQAVDTFVAALIADYVVVLELFLRTVAGTDQRKQAAFKKLVKALKEGPLPLSQVITTLDMSKTSSPSVFDKCKNRTHLFECCSRDSYRLVKK